MDAPNRGLPIVIGVGIVATTAVLAKIFLFGNKKKKAPITLQDPNLELHDATDLRSQLAASEEKATILAAELQVTKQHVEERRIQSEKLQKRFDSELSKVQEEIRTEKSVRERLQREKDELVSNFQNLHDATDLRSQLAASEEKATILAAELQVTKQHVEERRIQSEKLRKRFDSELSEVQEEIRTEKSVRERLQREKDELLHDATDLRSQLAASEEKATILAAELQVTKQHVEERRIQSEKLRKRFDSDLSKVQKKNRTGKRVGEKHQKLERKTFIWEKDKTQMFPEICLEVVNAVGGNTLIPSPSSDASMHLLPLNVVTMRKKRKMVHFYTKEYSTYDFSLTDLLIDKPVLNPKVIEHKVSSYSQKSTSTWCGMFGRLIKNVIGLSVNVFDEASITNKYGQLLLREIGDASFISALEERKLNLEHHFIQQIVKTQTVLCVVKGVLTTSGEVLVKETRKADMNIKAAKKSSDTKHAHCGADASTERDMVLNPGTTLAYKVWELEVNVDNGHIIPVMTEDCSGGFIKKIEDNVAELLKDFKNILQPLHDCAKAEDEHIKYSLLVLMTCSSDVLALSKILSKAENGRLNEDKDTLDKQFINNDTVWFILTYVGVQTRDGRVLCEGKATPILTAVSYMIDAILELENDFLNIIYDCDEQQLKTLLKIFESAVASSTTISVDVDMSSVLKEPVSSFLTRLKFTVCNDSIQPPKAKTCIVECIFCVLYCLL